MIKPTQSDLDKTHEVLLWVIKHTEENEPQAVNFIVLCEDLSSELPTSMADFDEE